jgi:hypothetical protein
MAAAWRFLQVLYALQFSERYVIDYTLTGKKTVIDMEANRKLIKYLDENYS